MAKYTLSDRLPEDSPPRALITTGGDGMILTMQLPTWRASDQVAKALLRAWQIYAETSGSPSEAQTIDQFIDWLMETYAGRYVVRRR